MSSLGNGMTECEMVSTQPENIHNSVVLEHIRTSREFYGSLYQYNFCNNSFKSI